jgi:ribonucleotide monophosphatase NagD (HAD superfamily)
MGARVIYMGKPSKTFYSSLPEATKVPKDTILMIGDTLETDILGAQNFGIDSLLVFTGNAAAMLEKMVGPDPLKAFFEKERIKPTYYGMRLGW